MAQKLDLFVSKEILEDLYHNKRMLDKEIGKIYNRGSKAVSRLRKRYGIKTISRIERNPLSKEVLYQEYVINKLYDWQIGEKYNYAEQYISHLRDKYKINTINESDRYPLITKEQFEADYLINKMTLLEISSKYNIDWVTACRYKKKYNIETLEVADRNTYVIPEDNISKQIILGTILGDGHLNKIWKNVRLEIKHYELQKDWVKLKHKYIKSFLHMSDIEIFKSNTGFKSKYNQYRTVSKVHPWLTKIYSSIYHEDGIKYINIDYLDMLDEIGVATWFIDDATYTNKLYILASDCFTYQDHLLIQKWFKEKWSINCIIKPIKNRNNQYRLHFTVASSQIIRQWVEDLIGDIPLMRHKYTDIKLKDLLNVSQNNQIITKQESVVNL